MEGINIEFTFRVVESFYGVKSGEAYESSSGVDGTAATIEYLKPRDA